LDLNSLCIVSSLLLDLPATFSILHIRLDLEYNRFRSQSLCLVFQEVILKLLWLISFLWEGWSWAWTRYGRTRSVSRLTPCRSHVSVSSTRPQIARSQARPVSPFRSTSLNIHYTPSMTLMFSLDRTYLLSLRYTSRSLRVRVMIIPQCLSMRTRSIRIISSSYAWYFLGIYTLDVNSFSSFQTLCFRHQGHVFLNRWMLLRRDQELLLRVREVCIRHGSKECHWKVWHIDWENWLTVHESTFTRLLKRRVLLRLCCEKERVKRLISLS